MLIEPEGLPRSDHASEYTPGLSMPRRRSEARSMLRVPSSAPMSNCTDRFQIPSCRPPFFPKSYASTQLLVDQHRSTVWSRLGVALGSPEACEPAGMN